MSDRPRVSKTARGRNAGANATSTGAGSFRVITLFDCPSFSADPLAEASQLGLEVVSSVVTGGEVPTRRDQPIALLVGSEAHGLAVEDIEASNRLVTLSLAPTTESLNAATAAAILMYALRSENPRPANQR